MSTISAARRIAVVGGLFAVGALVPGACAADGGSDETGTIVTSAPPEQGAEQQIPEVAPRAEGDCPYLAADTAAELSGVTIDGVRLDDTIAPPACFFYGTDGAIRFTTTVYSLDSGETAQQLVESSAGAQASTPVDIGDWSGARSGGEGDATLAVSHEDRVFLFRSRSVDTDRLQPVAQHALGEID